MVKEFWALDQTLMTKENIIAKAREYFSEEFIDNYSEWKNRIFEMNKEIKASLKSYIPENEFLDMGFDEFCQAILDNMQLIIETNGNIITSDIPTISLTVRRNFAQRALDEHNKKKYSIANILNSIKKVSII